MKEKIYTIPINEALSENGECLLCTIKKKLDRRAVESLLGTGVMEPAVRLITNRHGFCRPHLDAMLAAQNSLSAALLLETHIDEILSLISPPPRTRRAGRLAKAAGECALCDKVRAQMRQYTDNFLYLLKTEQSFRESFLKSKGLCLPHFAAALSHRACGRRAGALLCEMQNGALSKLKEEICAFKLSFDYRNGENTNSPLKKAAGRLRGFWNI